jgi:DNA-binding transcriptional ArsR family regulator
MPYSGPSIAEVGHLIGDQARAQILAALMDGRALTASELAFVAHVSPQTTSSHLSKLTDGRLLSMHKQGRHRYYRLASPQVAQMVEAVMGLAEAGPPRHRPRSRVDAELRAARTCYDHLAGRLGVALADAMTVRGLVVIEGDGGEVTPEGFAFLSQVGIDLAAVPTSRRAFCRPCLDWSERRPHLAGWIGSGLARHCFAEGWIRRQREGRAVTVTPLGAARIAELFGVCPEAWAAVPTSC